MRAGHAASVGEVHQVAVLAAVRNQWPGSSRDRAQQPFAEVAYVEFNGIHDAVDIAGRIGHARRSCVAGEALARIVEVDRVPAVLGGPCGLKKNLGIVGGGQGAVAVPISLFLEDQNGVRMHGV